MNIRNIVILTGLCIYGMSTETAIVIQNQYKKAIVLKLDGKELPGSIATNGTYTLPSPLPNKIEVASEGGIRYHSGIQKELDEVRQLENATITILDTSNPFSFEYSTSKAPSRPGGATKSLESQLYEGLLDIDQYIAKFANSPQLYGEYATTVKRFVDEFNQESKQDRENPMAIRQHPYKRLVGAIRVLKANKDVPVHKFLQQLKDKIDSILGSDTYFKK